MTDSTTPQDDAAMSPASDGSVAGKPVAWAALREDGDIAWIGYTPEGAADGACGRRIVPLYLKQQKTVVLLPALDPNGAPGWNAAIGAVREALAEAGVDWDTE